MVKEDQMAKKYVVRLEAAEREELQRLVSVGRASARKITRARVLLQTDASEAGPAYTDEQIAQGLGISVRAIEMLRQRFVEDGLDRALTGKPQGPRRLKLDGEKEAKLVALCCSSPPEGQERWTLRLLAGRLVELQVVDAVSHETVRRVLQKTN
jgi:transposase